MKLILHIVKKDLHRFWVPIALFAVVIAAKLLVGAVLRWQSGPLDVAVFVRLTIYANFGSVVECLVILVLVAALVHEDPLLGTSAFWMTKPVSGLGLLAAKIVTLVLVFGVLPALLCLPWWLVSGFGLRDIAPAIGAIAAINGMIVLLGLPFAVLTGTFARYLSALLVAIAVTGVVNLMHAARNLHELVTPPGLYLTRFWVSGALVIVAVAALVVHQYRTRRFWPALALFVAAFATTLSIFLWWPWDGSMWLAHRNERNPDLTRRIELTLGQASLQYPKSPLLPRTAYALWTGFTATGVPEGDVVLPVFSSQRWRWRDGTTLDREGAINDHLQIGDRDAARLLNLPEPAPDPDWLEFLAEQARARGAQWNGYSPAPSHIRAFSIGVTPFIPSDLGKRLRDDPATYEFDGWFELLEPTLVAETPLHDGGTIARGSYGARINRSWRDEKRGLAVSLVEWVPTHTTRQPATLGIPRSAFFPETQADLWAVNRAQGSIVPEGPGEYRRIDVAGVSVIQRVAYFHPHRHWDRTSKTWIEDSGWFNGLTLATFTLRPAATFHRHLDAEHFKIASTSGEQE